MWLKLATQQWKFLCWSPYAWIVCTRGHCVVKSHIIHTFFLQRGFLSGQQHTRRQTERKNCCAPTVPCIHNTQEENKQSVPRPLTLYTHFSVATVGCKKPYTWRKLTFASYHLLRELLYFSFASHVSLSTFNSGNDRQRCSFCSSFVPLSCLCFILSFFIKLPPKGSCF